MKNNQQEADFYRLSQLQNKYSIFPKQDKSEWQFQKVQSVYEVDKDQIKKYNQEYLWQNFQEKLQAKYPHENTKFENRNHFINRNDPYIKKTLVKQFVSDQNMRKNNNPSFKSNSETNIISQSQSLEYLSSQEPSFLNQNEFTVVDDFNMDHISPIKGIMQSKGMSRNKKKVWDQPSVLSGNNQLFTFKQKFIKIYEFIQELKFMKEGFQSKLKQQKVFFTNEIQQLKRLLFKLNINYEKEIFESTKKEVRPISRQSSFRQSGVIMSQQSGLDKQFIELKNYCRKLEEEKVKSQQRYQTTLKKYQQEIQQISEEFQRKLALQKNSQFSNQEFYCRNCVQRQQQSIQKKEFQTHEIQIWKNRLRQEQQIHSQAMRKLEEKVYRVQEEFEYLQKGKIQVQKKLKQKQKQIAYRQAEIQYRLKDLQRRQKDLQMNQMLLQKEKQQLQKKKEKISQYEFRVLRQERKQKNDAKEKQIMTSQYFNNCEKKKILSRVNLHGDRNDSVSSKGSRIDINARLREIQMMKNKGSRHFEQNATSRNCSRESRTSGYKEYSSPRVTLLPHNLKDYGANPPIPSSAKQHTKGNSETFKLSQKLNKLTQTLQKELREMD